MWSGFNFSSIGALRSCKMASSLVLSCLYYVIFVSHLHHLLFSACSCSDRGECEKIADNGTSRSSIK